MGYYGAIDERKAREQPGVRETLPEPEVPDILIHYSQIKSFDKLPWQGGMSDQPFQYMYELSCVEEAVQIRTKHLELQERMAAEQRERLNIK